MIHRGLMPSESAIKKAYSGGQLLIGECVLAEITPALSEGDLESFLSDWNIRFMPSTQESAKLAGKMYSEYLRRSRHGKRALPDFLIGAHTLCEADCLLARDWSYYRDYSLMNKAFALLGPPKTSLEQGVEEIVAWLCGLPDYQKPYHSSIRLHTQRRLPDRRFSFLTRSRQGAKGKGNLPQKGAEGTKRKTRERKATDARIGRGAWGFRPRKRACGGEITTLPAR